MPLFLRFRRLRSSVTPPVARTASCDSCPLATCQAGSRATVLCILCPAHDAQRLRTLGLFEGVEIAVVDTRSGMVLDVRGSRLALGQPVVAGIRVRTVSA